MGSGAAMLYDAAIMRLSMRASMIMAAVFAAVCLGFAFNGFSSLGEINDPAQLADAKGFAWFWTFLAGVALMFGVLSWWIQRTEENDGDS